MSSGVEISAATFPVLPSPQNAFALQPIAQGYLTAARAVATAIMYRYTGINLGHGMSGACAGSGDYLAALEAAPSTLHYAQIVLAEWLVVYAALATEYGAIGTVGSVDAACPAFAGVAVVNTPGDMVGGVSDAVLSIGSGAAFPSLSCVLAYLADWYGAVAPAYYTLPNGDVRAVTQPLMADVHFVRVSNMPVGCLAQGLLAQGLALTDGAFLRAIQLFLDGAAMVQEPHSCRLVLGEAHGDRAALYLMESTTASCGVAAAHDAAGVHGRHDTAVVCSLMTVSTAQVDALLTSTCACVVHGRTTSKADDEWQPVLPVELSDAVLQPLALQASAASFVAALDAGNIGAAKADVERIVGRLQMLYSQADDATAHAVVRAELDRRYAGSDDADACDSVSAGAGAVAGDGDGDGGDDRDSAGNGDDSDGDGDAEGHGGDSEVAEEAKMAASPPVEVPAPDHGTVEPLLLTDRETAVQVEVDAANDDSTGPLAAPIVILPGRHVHKHAPFCLSLYYVPAVWGQLQPAVQTLNAFFATHVIVQERACASGACPRWYLVNGAPVGTIDRSAQSKAGYVVSDMGPDGPVLPLPDARLSVSGQLHWSLMVMREDLMWLALQPEPIRQTFGFLWSRHVRNLAGRRFDDKVAEAVITEAVGGGLGGAATWIAGVMAEIVFAMDDPRMMEILGALSILDRAIATGEHVVELKGGQLVCALPRRNLKLNTVTSLRVVRHFHAEDDGGLAPRAVKPYVARIDELCSWSEPMLRGLCINTTQAAFLTAMGSPADIAAFTTCVDACDSDVANMAAMRALARQDLEDAAWFVHHARATSVTAEMQEQTTSTVTLSKRSE